MGLYFKVYDAYGNALNTDNELKLVCWEVFLNNDKLGKPCVIEQDKYLKHISNWTCDETNQLWIDYHSQDVMMRDDTLLCTYYNNEEIKLLINSFDDKDLRDTFVEKVGNQYGIIVQIF